MFQPGEEGHDGAQYMINEGVLDAAGGRPVAAYAAARLLGPVRPCAVRHPAGPDDGRGRRARRDRARARRARLTAAPVRRSHPGRLRDGHRAADAGDQAVRRVRPGGHHGRQLPRRHHGQRHPGRGALPGHGALVLRGGPGPGAGGERAAGHRHRQRARPAGQRGVPGRLPGHGQRRGRGGVRRPGGGGRVRQRPAAARGAPDARGGGLLVRAGAGARGIHHAGRLPGGPGPGQRTG